MNESQKKSINEFLSKTSKNDLYNMLVSEKQAAISFKNMCGQFHKLSFLGFIELYKVDPNNRLFNNGAITNKFKDNIIAASKIPEQELPAACKNDFAGDNDPGVTPTHLRG